MLCGNTDRDSTIHKLSSAFILVDTCKLPSPFTLTQVSQVLNGITSLKFFYKNLIWGSEGYVVLHPSQWRHSNTFSQVLKGCKKKKGKGKRKGVQKSLYGERDLASKKPLLSPIPELPEVSETPLVGSLVRRTYPGSLLSPLYLFFLSVAISLSFFSPFLFIVSRIHKFKTATFPPIPTRMLRSSGQLPWRFSGQDSRLPMQGAWVWSLVRELRSHMLQGVAKKACFCCCCCCFLKQ